MATPPTSSPGIRAATTLATPSFTTERSTNCRSCRRGPFEGKSVSSATAASSTRDVVRRDRHAARARPRARRSGRRARPRYPPVSPRARRHRGSGEGGSRRWDDQTRNRPNLRGQGRPPRRPRRRPARPRRAPRAPRVRRPQKKALAEEVFDKETGEEFDIDHLYETYREYGERLAEENMTVDCGTFLQERIDAGENVMLEGAQGTSRHRPWGLPLRHLLEPDRRRRDRRHRPRPDRRRRRRGHRHRQGLSLSSRDRPAADRTRRCRGPDARLY